MTVREAVVEDIVRRQGDRDREYESSRDMSAPARLYVSALGYCHRKAYLDMALKSSKPSPGGEPIPHDEGLLELFALGNMYEDLTRNAFAIKYPEAKEQTRVGNEIWSGKTDITIEPDIYPEYVNGAIIEHKATTPKNFRGGILPIQGHTWQVLAYKYLMDDPHIETILYYRGWNQWAEIRVWEHGDEVVWEGLTNNGRDISGSRPGTCREAMETYERFFDTEYLPPIKDPFGTKRGGCYSLYGKRAYPSCRWLKHCHLNLPHTGTVKVDASGR